MKYSLVILALIGTTSAVKLTENFSFAEMSQEDLKSMVDAQIAEGVSLAASKDDATKKDSEMKGVAEALGKKVIDRLNVYGVPYGYPIYPYIPYTSPYYYDIVGIVNSAVAYNDMIKRYEVANAIAGLLNPSYDSIVGALKAAIAPAAVPAAAPAAPAALLQTETPDELVMTEGVPVFVNPVLIPNEAGDEFLGQNDIVIDGVNGYDFVQLHGIPVGVNPESMLGTNTEA